MTLDEFLDEHLAYQAFELPNFSFWGQSVIESMPLLGEETDDTLDQLVKEMLDYYSGTDISDIGVDNIHKKIGFQRWADQSPINLKYQCLNAIASSREACMADIHYWRSGIVTAFQIINLHHDKDQVLIEYIRKSALTKGVNLHEI